MFNRKQDPSTKRTPGEIQADPAIAGPNYVVIPDTQRHQYEARGWTLHEDLTGPMCLMKRQPENEEATP